VDNDTKQPSAPRPRRDELHTNVEFIADFDLIQAQGIDLSEGGVSFGTSEGLPFEMRFELDGQVHQQRARLIWMKQQEDGTFQYGLKFIPSLPVPKIA
jgi:hypothetical protein